MARKPTLSPSKITTYLACPSKYRWTYVDERGKWYLRSKHYYSFGTTLHKVLQRFHDAGDQGVETVEQAVSAVEESWIDAGYRSPQEMEEALGEGKAMIEQYVAHALSVPREAKVLLIEKTLRMDLGDFVLLGRLDRVDEYPDGMLEVVDYKTGRNDVREEDVAHDLAMACYQLLVSHHYPDRPVRASIVAVRTGASASAALSIEDRAHFQQDLIEIGKEILHRDYDELVPAYRDLCPECDFLTLCRKHPEFEEPRVVASPEES